MAIIPVGYPANTLSHEQLNATRCALIDSVMEQSSSNTRPKFRKCTYKQGYLEIVCVDKDTAKWLKDATAVIKPWEGASLEAVEVSQIPKQALYIGYFPDSIDRSDGNSLRLLQNQNDNFCTERWKIVKRTTILKMVELLLVVDEASVKLITSQHNQLNYVFGRAARMRQLKEARPPPPISLHIKRANLRKQPYIP
ncbi:uncharacterized protein LOC131694630 [Topomyia yanbarensis]|uniref:uncharacterized protein LOC131694630 n=1 Tax=Topomyia yanbarensis TaxID=2498891 RepID=UPI00273A7569|nr:uncharacterized protein LOC131694630 [Topomyia yanbarensis]